MIASRVEAFCRARGTGAGRADSGLTPPFRRFRAGGDRMTIRGR
jgi:hypothetical protein